MKNHFFLSAICAILLLSSGVFPVFSGGTSNENATGNFFKQLEDTIPVMMKASKVPGLSVALVNREGIVWSFSSGTTKREGGVPVTGKTLFSIQSMSKNFTATAVLLAVQEGLLDLDEPVTTYLPDFTVHSRFEENPEQKITLRLLLGHRTGLCHEAPVGNNYQFEAGEFEEHIASISGTWLRFPVGQRFSYSNLGIDLAGYILEKVSGNPFAQYVKEKLLLPAGLTSSTFDMETILGDHSRARGHSSLYPELPVRIAMIPAGGLYACTDEMASYIRFHLNGGRVDGRVLLKEELHDQMAEIQSRLPLQTDGYGLGTSVMRRRGVEFHSHGGGGYGFLSSMLWSEEFGAGLVILTNYAAHNLQNDLAFEILGGYIGMMTGKEFTEVPYPSPTDECIVQPDTSTWKRYSGNWLYNSGGFMLTEYLDGQFGAGPADKFDPFHFISPDELYHELSGLKFYYRFRLNDVTGHPVMIREYDGEHLDFNDGPFVGTGNAGEEYEKYTGNYVTRTYGIARRRPYVISLRKGWLWFDHMRLEETLPGLFFTSNGECLDLRGEVYSWRNIPLERQ